MSDTSLCPECGAKLPTGQTEGLCPKCLMRAGIGSEPGASQPSGAVGATSPHTGRFVPPEPESLAPHFPQLEILELVGHGGMGAVYKARQIKLDRLVALKIIRPESADDPAFAERFGREARMLARLNHPNIVGVHDFGEVDLECGDSSPLWISTSRGQPMEKESGAEPPHSKRTLYYFLMEYVEGANLRQLIRSKELAPQQALGIVPEICEALQFAHDEGVVHRDIKPENILVDKKGRVKIADFGLAKLKARSPEEFTLTDTHQVIGTARYMAPEQMEGSHQVDHRADIYSLGVVFYEMLTGEVPAGHFDPPSKKVQVDVRLDEIVLRSLAREPQRRYQQASEVKTDVESVSKRRTGFLPAPASAGDGSAAQHVPHGRPATSATNGGQVGNLSYDRTRWPVPTILASLLAFIASFLPWAIDLTDITAWNTFIRVDEALIPNSVVAIAAIAITGLLALEGFHRYAPRSLIGALAAYCLGHTIVAAFQVGELYSAPGVGLFTSLFAFGFIFIARWRPRFRTAAAWTAAYIVASILNIVLLWLGILPALGIHVHHEAFQAATGMVCITGGLLFLCLSASTFIQLQLFRSAHSLGHAAFRLGRAAKWFSGFFLTLCVPLAGVAALCAIEPPVGTHHVAEALLTDPVVAILASALGTTIVAVVATLALHVFSRAALSKAEQFEGPHRPVATGASPGGSDLPAQPQFSGTAIGGALLFLAMLVATAVAAAVLLPYSMQLRAEGNPFAWLWFLLATGPAILGGLAMTIFGVVSISEIRHSGGRLTGLGLAFFDAIFLPLLLLDAAVYGILLAFFWPSTGDAQETPFLTALLFAVPIWIATNLDIARRIWRWTSRATEGEKADGLSQEARHGRQVYGWAFIAVCILIGLRIARQHNASMTTGSGALPSTSSDRSLSEASTSALEAFMQAAAEGSAERVKQHLAEGIEINLTDGNGETALMKAAAAGEPLMVALLMLRGADETLRDNDGKAAIMHAVEQGHASTVQMFVDLSSAHWNEDVQFRLTRIVPDSMRNLDFSTLRFDAGQEWQDHEGETALMKAAARGDVAIYNVLEQWSEEKAQDKSGRTALVHAIENRREQFLEEQFNAAEEWLQLASPGDASSALVNFPHLIRPDVLALTDASGRTPLEIAEAMQFDEIASRIRQFCESVIDRTTQDIAKGHKYLTVSYRHRGHAHRALGQTEQANADFREAERLAAAEENDSLRLSVALHEACRIGDVSRVKELLDAGVSVNDKDADGQTPLMKAVAYGHRSLAVTLVVIGAALSEQDKHGHTAVIMAVETNDVAFLKRLKELEKISYEEDSQQRKLQLSGLAGAERALTKGRAIDLVRLDFDAVADIQDKNGETASMKAARAGYWDCFDLVASGEEHYLACDKEGRNIAMYMAISGREQPFQYLADQRYFGRAKNIVQPHITSLERSLSVLDVEANSVLQLAVEHGQDHIATLLRRHLEAVVANQTTEIEQGGVDVQQHYRLRGLAWRALGEHEKANADFETASTRPADANQ